MPIFGLGRHKYEDNETLYNDLFVEVDAAFKYLYKKVLPTIMKMARLRHLSNEEGEDLIQDSILLFILKMKNGEYKFEGHSPASYVITTANFLILNIIRKKAKIGNTEDTDSDIPDKDFIELLEFKDSAKVLEQIIISKLGEKCRNLIWWKFIDELKDAEVIEKKPTLYKNVATLRNARCECLQKLKELMTGKDFKGK